MNLKNITVIVPTKNEEKNVITFLDSLPKDVNLIIVDSSSDRTRELIAIRRPKNTEVIFEECNIPQARQFGANSASTEWLLYSDIDIVFDSDYFKNLESIEIDEKIGAIMGAKLSQDKYKLYFQLYSFSIKFWSWFTIPIGSGSNMIIRKTALSQVGGFDFSLSSSEDGDILWRIRSAKWKVPFEDKLKVYEIDHRRLDKGIFKKICYGTLRSFLLITGINKKAVQKSDWGYWKK